MRCLTVGVSVLRFHRGGVNEVPCTQCSFVAVNADFAPLHGESLDKLALQSNSAVSGQTGSVFWGSQAACSSGFAIIHRSVFDCTSRTLALQGKSVPWLLMSIESDLLVCKNTSDYTTFLGRVVKFLQRPAPTVLAQRTAGGATDSVLQQRDGHSSCNILLKTNSNDFGCFWDWLADSNSNFVVAKFFLNDSNFWCVQSSITHNVAVHVPELWPVCAHRIPIRILLCP